MVFKLWSHKDYIYGYLQKIRSVFMMCVSSWRLFFRVNRSNLSVESVCSFFKWSKLMNNSRSPCRDTFRKPFFFFFLRVHVSRCGNVYILVVQLYYFCIVLNAVFLFFSFETCALLCDYGLTTLAGYVKKKKYGDLSLLFCFASLFVLIKEHKSIKL